jgi:two-component system OmpR family response regulator
MSSQASAGASLSKILIVEDDKDLRESMLKYLVGNGLDVVAVGSAIEFYRTIALNSYALAIIDRGLPDQSGLVLVKYLRGNTDMRVIMLTALASIDEKLEGYDAGADVYLAKPADFREILATINNLLGRIEVIPNTGMEIIKSVVAENNKQWQLRRSEWLLINPEGQSVKLTLKEFEFTLFLATTETIAASRKELLKLLEYQNNESGNRALESLVHRLRTKTAVLGSFPIQTAHGVGYSFSVSVLVV